MIVYPDKIANIVIGGLRATMKDKDRNATGKTRDSLYYEWDAGESTLEVFGPDHFRYVDQGRGPGEKPPIGRIIEWCIAKSVPVQFAWAIRTNIGKYGAPRKKDADEIDKSKINIVSETLKEIMPEITKEVGEQVNERFKATINPLWSKPTQ